MFDNSSFDNDVLFNKQKSYFISANVNSFAGTSSRSLINISNRYFSVVVYLSFYICVHVCVDKSVDKYRVSNYSVYNKTVYFILYPYTNNLIALFISAVVSPFVGSV
jgi:hypothetical protein